jgi:hypothetical protein
VQPDWKEHQMGRVKRRKRRDLRQRSIGEPPLGHAPKRRLAGWITMTTTVNTTLAVAGMSWTAIAGQWWATIVIGAAVSASATAVRLYLR